MAQAGFKKTDEESLPLLSEPSEILGVAETPAPATEKSVIQVLPLWWRITRLWFFGEDKWRARAYVVAAIVLALLRTILLVRISYTQRNFETALAEKDRVRFHQALVDFGGIIALAAPFLAATDFVEDRLKLEWRAWLTARLLRGYYGSRAFYRLHHHDSGVDNPDQRICDDVPAFTSASTDLLIGLSRKIFGVIAFSGVLWMEAPNLVIFLAAYSAVGTWLTTSVFGKRLTQLTYATLKREGDLRFALLRTSENSESIAFYGGEGREAASAAGRLVRLVGLGRRRTAWLAGLSLWSNLYGYATMLVPSVLTAPRYFAGEIEFGVMTQVGFAFRHIEMALNFLVDNLARFSGLAAESERLDALLAVLAPGMEEPLRILHIRGSDWGLTLSNLTVRTPGNGALICQGLDFRIEQGQSVLIVGPSGCGKSSLLRAICGLWTDGSGTVHSPAAEAMFFLPQKPYMPLGNLRQQLQYPAGDQAAGPFGAETKDRSATDDRLLELLGRVALPGLAARVGGLDAEVEWSHVLSLGEQQRVAFLRLLLREPALAFLDEATGALDAVTEAVLYRVLQRHAGCYVSVGHRKELTAFHSHVLEHTGGWEWRFCSMSEYLKSKT